MTSRNFTIEELILDDYFRKWVYGTLPEEDNFWESWIAESPGRLEQAERARFIIRSLNMEHKVVSEKRIRENVKSIMAEMEREEVNKRRNVIPYLWKAAAAIVIFLGLYTYFARPDTSDSAAYEARTETLGTKTIEKINNAGKPLTIILSDGSSITLQPGSKLSYPEEFGPDTREVILSGEGFFDIARQPERPFLVYANEIVTRVLGTSFHVRAYEKDDDVTVRVVTGKVSVLTSKGPKEKRTSASPEGLILTPNQMAVYARSPERLTRTLVDNPGIVKTSSRKSSDYNFEDTPVAQVFQALEEGYGIPIVYNAGQLAECTVTAPLENENLYEKLDMICKVIRATYEVVDAQVIIDSKGCL